MLTLTRVEVGRRGGSAARGAPPQRHNGYVRTERVGRASCSGGRDSDAARARRPYAACVLEPVRIDEADPLAVRLKEIAIGIRVEGHLFDSIEDPAPGSPFVEANALYPWEKASDWCHEYLSSALQSALLWADFYAPLSVPDGSVTHIRPRPAQGLARSALESASQAAWVMTAEAAEELAVRHLRLMHSDFVEQRKAYRLQGDRVESAKAQLELFMGRLAEQFEAGQVTAAITYMTTIRETAVARGTDPDSAEFLWRLASGATHGKRWAALEINHIEQLEEYEDGQWRVSRTPRLDSLVSILGLTYDVLKFAVAVFAARSGADVVAARRDATLKVAQEMPVQPERRQEHAALIEALQAQASPRQA